MDFPRSEAVAPHLTVLETASSTNDVLAAAASVSPDFTVVATLDQTAGRGRLGRVWFAPTGKTLAVSVLLRPVTAGGGPLGLEHYGWVPLIAGVALARSVQALGVRGRVGLKWPNDPQIGGFKVGGILSELGADGASVIVGAGLNLSLSAEELPTPTSTSLALAGAQLSGIELADAALAGYLREFRGLMDAFLLAGGDEEASGIRAIVRDNCTTIGERVRVQLPGGEDLLGTAIDIDSDGRIMVERSTDGHVQAVAAGDVTHLRYE